MTDPRHSPEAITLGSFVAALIPGVIAAGIFYGIGHWVITGPTTQVAETALRAGSVAMFAVTVFIFWRFFKSVLG